MFRPKRFIPPLGPPRLDPRKRLMAEFRGIELSELEKGRSRSEKSVANLMPDVLKGLGMDRRRAEAEILRVWNNLIDPSIAAHAQPTGINKGTLFVTVDSSPWLDEIVRYRRKEILARLQHSFGKDLVQKISFRVG
jgi:predicted nucleic acid-binding Zn ribbon protein